MPEENWQCSMCAAFNVAARHACMVCDTFRVLGGRRDGGSAAPGRDLPGDLLAPAVTDEAFQGRGGDDGEWSGDEGLPPVRLMEPTRNAGARTAPPRTAEEPPGEPPGRNARPRTSRVAGWGLTAGVPARGPTAGGGPVRDTARPQEKPGGAGRRSTPRRPPGTVRALTLAVVGLLALTAWWVLPRVGGEPEQGADGSAAPPACPGRVAALLPGAGEGPLVAAFETGRHRIVLCEDGEGDLYYFGEFLEESGEPIVVPARRTGDGFVAEAGTTRYRITGGQVVISTDHGGEVARHDLVETGAPE
ncbi:hypothetical protein [Nocardiopsis sp. YSL2]|uniref:hypothetical protein n=1 Tax=Nocardiopsis sp. YSL2 TaxID=2939492 RepID=UPI0026F44073|nr:hypothetical protein [Nocardiopsis sp. YSL2]